ncbi:peptidoglycan recognition family protein [Poseidonibacter lekithochrous]|uniref:peptidoglycan recognition protein family protein n=2 Tax=Poseidonibacter lekithochrous TaxID=1904463 RepID=UPI000AC44BA4|nr:peptidoglycan recognition family protein [Poseidonibacter lekithochrous]QKJ22698.1 N-acetylmuramoyl-L-alanine amidase, AmpD family [Poseidonibacter lekithochrous]
MINFFMKKIMLFIVLISNVYALEIINKPIEFTQLRVELTKEYIKKRYNKVVEDINIIPKMIVIHHTALDDFSKSYDRLNPEILLSDRKDISNASKLNVSAHFLVDSNGKIYSLMPETYMARHVIGLNYSSIGIENVGGQKKGDKLTSKQLEANIKLVKYLKNKYKSIEYLIGHYEYRKFENSKLWLEKDKNYRTIKNDPHKSFMEKLRKNLSF